MQQVRNSSSTSKFTAAEVALQMLVGAGSQRQHSGAALKSTSGGRGGLKACLHSYCLLQLGKISRSPVGTAARL